MTALHAILIAGGIWIVIDILCAIRLYQNAHRRGRR